MKSIFYTLLAIASVPLIAWALEPANPSGFCDRFIGEEDIATCKKKTEADDVDWYAATVCNLQTEDKAFWICWDSIKGRAFSPQALEKCGEDSAMDDLQRQKCVDDSRQNRSPSSVNRLFQPLIFKSGGPR